MNKRLAWEYAKRTLALLLAVAISVNGWLNYGISVRAAEAFTVELEEFTEESAGVYSVEYSDSVLETSSIAVNVKDSSDQLVDDANITWEKDGAAVTEIHDAGTYTCKAKNATGNGEATLTVTQKDLAIVWGGNTSFEYNGEVQIPTVTVGAWDVTTDSVDLPVTLTTDMVDKTVGDYVATVTLVDSTNYVLSGNTTCNYSVTPKQLNVDWGTQSFTYDGTAKTPTVTVDGTVADSAAAVSVALPGDDCTVEMSVPSMIDAGNSYTVKLSLGGTDKDCYALIETEKTYSVDAKDLNSSDIVVEGLDEKLSYIGTELKLSALKVLNGEKELVKDTDYTVAYSDNIAVSDSAKVTIEGIGNYTGTLNKEFSIVYNEETEAAEAELSGTQLEGCAEGWYSANDVVLKAPNGWEISSEQNGTWGAELVLSASNEEKNTVTYYLKKISADAAEQYISDAKTVEFYVDVTYPSITGLEVSDADLWTQSKVITINVEGNAIQRVYYVNGESAPETDVTLNGTIGTVDVTDYADDNLGLNYTFVVVDNAGHVVTQSISVNKIDVTAPTVSVKEGTADVAGTIYTNEVKTFEIICEDAAGESGIDETSLNVIKKVGDNEAIAVDVTDNRFSLEEVDKDNTIVYTVNVSDIAGRAAQEVTFTVIYDTTAPVITNNGLFEDDAATAYSSASENADDVLWRNEKSGTVYWKAEATDALAGIETVEVYKGDDIASPISQDTSGNYAVEITDDEYSGLYRIEVTDKAGNKSVSKQYIKVDRIPSAIKSTAIEGANNGNSENTWYNASDVRFAVVAETTGAEITKVFATLESNIGEAADSDKLELTLDGDVYRNLIPDTDFDYRTYYFYAEDEAGNITQASETQKLRRDSFAPDAEGILVSYSVADQGDSISLPDSAVAKLVAQMKNLFVKNRVEVTIYVPDTDKGEGYSEAAELTLKYNGTKYTLSCVAGEHAYFNEFDNRSYNIFEVVLPENADGKTSNINSKISITSLTDYAGNSCDVNSDGLVVESDSIIVVDDIEPVLNKVEYSTEQSKAEINEKTYRFYQKNDNATVKFEILETHYDLEAIDGTVSKPVYTVTPDLSDEMKPLWSFADEIAEATVKFPGADDAETEYVFSLSYKDPSGNLMVGMQDNTENVCTDGVFDSEIIVVDNVAPVLTQFEIVSNGGNLLAEDGIYYAENLTDKEDIKIILTIDDNDTYFDAENVSVEYSLDGTVWNVLSLKEEDAWSTGSKSHNATYYFDGTEEGEDTYQFRVSYKDRANNLLTLADSNTPTVNETAGGTYTSTKQIVIDHCVPKLTEMKFSEPIQMFDGETVGVNGNLTNNVINANTKLYYDQDAAVQFSITDKYLKTESVAITMYQRNHKAADWEEYKNLSINQTEESGAQTYSFTIPSEEQEYYFTVSYTDRARNMLAYDNSVETTDIKEAYENGIPADTDTFTAPVFVKDATAPVWKATYNPEPATYNSVQSVETVITVTEKNLDLAKTLVKISAKDINGKKIDAPELTGFIYDEDSQAYVASWADLLESFATVPSYPESTDVQTLTLKLTTEANYTVSVDVVDKVTKTSSYVKEYSVDRTAPSITIVTKDGNSYQDIVDVKSGLLDFGKSDITYSVINDGKFARIINKLTFGYFAQAKLVVHVKVHDLVSGVTSLVPTCVNEGKEVTDYILSEQKAIEGDKSVVQYDITLPIDFKGTIKMHGIDKAENVADDAGATGLIAETEKRHNQLASNAIKVLTPYSKTPNYYAGDVKVKFTSVDGYSGFYKVDYQAGTYVETVDYPEGEEICLEVVKEHTIASKNNNENNIKFVLGFEDNAAHKAAIAEKDIPKVHIDTTAPKLEVVYDNMDAQNEKYYKEPRIATVTITERNFDPTDTKLDITGPSVHISDWKHIAGNGCKGSSNSKDTYHTDGCQWECQIEFSEDGDYTFTCSTTDLAGNSVDYGQVDEFVIDQTIPEIKVTYDNYDVLNEFYYKEQRIATIEITEHNFNASDVITTMTSELEGRTIAIPTVSAWTSNGDVHRATIAYNYDADFTFDIEYIDLAGNEAADYEQDKFTVDMTAPEIEIYDIEDFSANNDVVAPGIRYSDTNYDADGTEVFMLGYRNGAVEMTGVRKITTNGVEFKLNDFERVPEMDDMYTMNAVVYDLAGNSSEASVMFSVNRFGSVYTFDEKTEALVGEKGSYYTDEAQELVVMETNVDTLEFKEITLNLNGKLRTLVENEDYKVLEDGSETSWKQYTYRISKENFEEEGTYILTIYSEDRATNTSDNNTKGKQIEFVVDKTNPSIVITGVENATQYREESREVTLDVEDSVRIGQLSVILNGEEKEYPAKEVIELNGKITFTVGSLNDWQTLKVIAHDAAGNVTEAEEITFLITPNVFVQFYMNKPLFFGTLGVAALIMGGLWFVLAKRKKESEENK